jgi:hypothetical protein
MFSKKLIIKTLVSFFFLLFINNTYSQENYLPGSILNLSGDTLKGFIDYRNWENNPMKISFRESVSSPVIIYSPNTISGFLVHNELYISAVVEAEISPTQFEELKVDPNIRIRKDTAFLQVMFHGTKNLYYYSDKNGKQNYYLKQWPDFELLVYKKYLKQEMKSSGTSSTINLIQENKRFIGQLALYFQDCPSLQPQINAATYSQKSLEDLFKAYYKCSGSKINYQYIPEKPVIFFGAIAGLSITTLNLSSSGNSWEYIANVDYSTSCNFSAGLSLDLLLARNQRKWSLYNELILSSYNVSSHSENIENANKYFIYDTKIGYSYIKLNNMMRYTYPVNEKTFVFANAGFSNGFALAETNSLEKETKFYADPVVTEGPAMKDTRMWEFGILAGIGAKYQKFSLEARYEGSNGMSAYPALVSRVSRLYFLLGYRF